MLGALACSGQNQPADGLDEGPPEVISAEMLSSTWQVRMASPVARAPFEAHKGWASIFQRDLKGALDAFEKDPPDGVGRARVHSELAGIYRQAALLSAHATVAVYGADRQDTDPPEVDYLLSVAQGLNGDCQAAGVALSRLQGVFAAGGAGALEAQVAHVSPWIENGCTWPPPSGAPIPGSAAEDAESDRPDMGELPHYSFEEQTDEKRLVKAGDPLTLVQISRWHEQRAVEGSSAEIVSQWLAPWALPAEPGCEPSTCFTEGVADIDDRWIFGGFYTSAADIAFVRAAKSDGASAVTKWQQQSPFAAAIAPAIEDGKVVPEKMLDQAAWLGKQLEAGMIQVAGREEAYQRGFADLGRVGVLRAAMVVADASDQYRDAGILRLNAKDRSVGPALDPVFFMSVAAWDAGNRNALRAQDIIHGLVGPYPAVEVARYPLDAMHVRLSRNTAPATPMH